MQLTFKKIAQNLRLANLNLLIPVLVFAEAFLKNTVLLVLMTLMTPFDSMVPENLNWEFWFPQVLIFVVVVLIFCLNNVSPQLILPNRRSRFIIGQWVISVSSLSIFLWITLPVVLPMYFRAGALYYRLAVVPVKAFVFLAWIAGLYMVFSSRASPSPDHETPQRSVQSH